MNIKDKKDEEIFGFNLYNYQNETINQIDDYGFYLIEMGTGNGKTEIALKTAYNLIKNKKCDGICFSLPTQVTSNAVYKRVEKFINNISDNDNVNLMHCNSNLALFEMGKKNEENFFNNIKHCRLFNNVIVCTADQLLFSVLNAKFNFMRVAALWRKVIIIDEIHCYDSYTTELIRKLTEICREMECVVIALSATVSDTLKKDLFNHHTFEKNYPLLSYVKNEELIQYSINGNFTNKNFDFIIEKDENKMIEQAINEVNSGKQILWIENSVAKAQDIFKKITLINNKIEAKLLHSKFIQHDRMKKEKELLKIWGKEEFNKNRNNNGRIVISTQVAEQSLDIDADKLYTRICPIDALAQRCGRIGRFGRKNNNFEIVILSEYSCHDYKNNNTINWFHNKNSKEYSNFIYPAVIMYKTLEYFEKKKNVSYPSDYREQLNFVYDNLVNIDNFSKFNTELLNYNNEKQQYKNLAQSLVSKYGKTDKNKDVMTRIIANKDMSVLLIKQIKDEIITLYSGDVIDLSKKTLDMIDKCNIEKNIVGIKIKKDFNNLEKLDCFKLIDDVELTAKVENNEVTIISNTNDSISKKKIKYNYDNIYGVFKK
jgi:CRISPR-associated endonuclease/helicase Cas3